MKTDELLTIAEVSELANVSKQSIYKRLDNTLNNYVVLVDNQKMLKKSVLKEVYNIDTINEDEQRSQLNEQQLINGKIEMLERLLESKEKEVEQLNQRIDFFQTELQKATDRESQSQQIIKMLTAKTTLEIEQKEEQEQEKKGFFSKIFG